MVVLGDVVVVVDVDVDVVVVVVSAAGQIDSHVAVRRNRYRAR